MNGHNEQWSSDVRQCGFPAFIDKVQHIFFFFSLLNLVVFKSPTLYRTNHCATLNFPPPIISSQSSSPISPQSVPISWTQNIYKPSIETVSLDKCDNPTSELGKCSLNRLSATSRKSTAILQERAVAFPPYQHNSVPITHGTRGPGGMLPLYFSFRAVVRGYHMTELEGRISDTHLLYIISHSSLAQAFEPSNQSIAKKLGSRKTNIHLKYTIPKQNQTKPNQNRTRPGLAYW